MREAFTDPKVAKMLTEKQSLDPMGGVILKPSSAKKINNFLFGIGLSPILETQKESASIDPDRGMFSEEEEIVDSPETEKQELRIDPITVSPEEEEEINRIYPPATKTVPQVNMGQGNVSSRVGIEELFPFDTTSRAIAKRRDSGGGITTLS